MPRTRLLLRKNHPCTAVSDLVLAVRSSLNLQAFGRAPDLRKALGNAAGDDRFAQKLVNNSADAVFKFKDPDLDAIG